MMSVVSDMHVRTHARMVWVCMHAKYIVDRVGFESVSVHACACAINKRDIGNRKTKQPNQIQKYGVI